MQAYNYSLSDIAEQIRRQAEEDDRFVQSLAAPQKPQAPVYTPEQRIGMIEQRGRELMEQHKDRDPSILQAGLDEIREWKEPPNNYPLIEDLERLGTERMKRISDAKKLKFGDFPRKLAIGLDKFGETVGRVIDVAGNYDPTRLMTDSGEGLLDTAGQWIESTYKKRGEASRAALSPAMKKAEKLRYTTDTGKTWTEAPVENFKSIFQGDAWKSPAKIIGSIIESAPSTAVGMGTGMAVTGSLLKTALVQSGKMSKGLAGIIGGFIGEGSVAGIESGKEIYDLVVAAPIEALSQTKEFRTAWESLEGEGLSDPEREKQVRELIADHAATMSTLKVFAMTGLLGSVSGHYMGKLIGGEATGGIPRRVLTAGGLETVQETPQSGYEVLERNYQIKKFVEPSKDIWEGVKEASTEGGVQGFAMGLGSGAGGIAAKGKTPPLPPPPSPDAPMTGADEVKDIGAKTPAKTQAPREVGPEVTLAEIIQAQQEAERMAETPEADAPMTDGGAAVKDIGEEETEVGGRRSEVGGQTTEGGGQRTDHQIAAETALQELAMAQLQEQERREAEMGTVEPVFPEPVLDNPLESSPTPEADLPPMPLEPAATPVSEAPLLPEDGGLRTEDGGQMSEVGSQTAEDRGQMSEVRSQTTEDGGQMSEVEGAGEPVDLRAELESILKDKQGATPAGQMQAIEAGWAMPTRKGGLQLTRDGLVMLKELRAGGEEQKTEDGGRKSEVGGKRAEVGGQRAENTQAAKEPWEMTREELSQNVFASKDANGKIEISYNGAPIGTPSLNRRYSDVEEYFNAAHKELVEQAVKGGKPVPETVLAEYPELKSTPMEEMEGAAEPEAVPEPQAETKEPSEMTRDELVVEAEQNGMRVAARIAQENFKHAKEDIKVLKQQMEKAEPTVKEMLEKIPNEAVTKDLVRQQNIRKAVLALAATEKKPDKAVEMLTGLKGKDKGPKLSAAAKRTIKKLGDVGSKVQFPKNANNQEVMTVTEIDAETGKVRVADSNLWMDPSRFRMADKEAVQEAENKTTIKVESRDYPNMHLMKNPAGTWSFKGQVPARLSYERTDGEPIAKEDIERIKQYGIFGNLSETYRTRTWKTKEEALAALKPSRAAETPADKKFVDDHIKVLQPDLSLGAGQKKSGKNHIIVVSREMKDGQRQYEAYDMTGKQVAKRSEWTGRKGMTEQLDRIKKEIGDTAVHLGFPVEADTQITPQWLQSALEKTGASAPATVQTKKTDKAVQTLTGLKPKTEAKKEPWEMGQLDYQFSKAQGYPPVLNANDKKIHEESVKQALKEGKPVPASVLEDYPWLQENQDVSEETVTFTIKSLQTGKEETLSVPKDVGKTAPNKPEYGAGNKIFTKDAADKARELLRKKLNQLNVGLDPELVQAGIQLAGYHIEAGARSFSAYTKAMVSDLGEIVRPYLRGWYEAVRYYPGFDSADMTKADDITEKDLKAADNGVKIKKTEGGGRDETGRLRGESSSGTVVEGAAGVSAAVRTPKDVGKVPGKPETTVPGNEAGRAEGVPVQKKAEGKPQSGTGPDTGNSNGLGEPDGRGTKRTPGRQSGNEVAGLGERPAGEQSGRAESGKNDAGIPEADQNHRINDDDILVPSGGEAKIKANIAAIRLLKKLQSENRNPTPEEKQTLARYTGWGQFSQKVFNQNYSRIADQSGTGTAKMPTYWSSEERDGYNAWADKYGKALHPALGGAMTQEEWTSAEASTINAHYTTQTVIKSMWALADRLGFMGGAVLEPAGGIGHFFGLMPPDVSAQSALYGVEKDTLSAQIFQKLYPEAKVENAPFERSKIILDNSMDLVISNVPFANVSIRDKNHPDYSGWSLHNYYFGRMLTAAKPGGLVMAITSSWTMDAKSNAKVREYLAGKADLVGAIRLPNTAFKENAGTEVTTDIIVLRKKGPTPVGYGQEFTTTQRLNTKENQELLEKFDKKKAELNQAEADKLPKDAPKFAKERRLDRIKSIKAELSKIMDELQAAYRVNEYFIDHPDMVMGKHAMTGTMYAKESYTVDPTGNLQEQIAKAIGAFPENIVNRREEAEKAPEKWAGVSDKEGTLVRENGKIYLVENGRMIAPTWVNSKGEETPIVQQAKIDRMNSYLDVRDAASKLFALMDREDATDAEIKQHQAELNKTYDAHVKKFKAFGNTANAWLADVDADFGIVDALEREEEEETPTGNVKVFAKADVFTKRTKFPFKEPYSAENLEDAVALSIVYRGGIDPDYVKTLIGEDSAEGVTRSIIEGGHGFINPETGLLEQKDLYLSGNVKRKLLQAEAAVKAGNDLYKSNVEALKPVIPADIDIEFVSFKLGSTWIPTETVKDFLKDVLDVKADISYVETEHSGRWRVGVDDRYGVKNRETYGTGDFIGSDLVEMSLNFKRATVKRTETDENGNKRTWADKDAEKEANLKMQEINEAFVRWAKTHDKWASELTKIYNDEKNGVILRKHQEPKITHYPGASTVITLRPHQKIAVSRALQEPVLLAYGVGTGKTFIFITAAMEMKRIGTAKKPVIVVHNSTIDQYRKSFQVLYPGAKVLIPNFRQRSARMRKKTLVSMATGLWDAIVLPQSFFDGIANDPEKEAAFVEDRIAEMDMAIAEATEEEGEKSFTVKDMVKAKERRRQKLADLLERRKDEVLHFEQMGIDAMLIDEAHAYKRSEFFTKMNKVKGIDSGSSQRSTSLILKSEVVRRKTGGKNVITATGTPISNTMAELWTMLRYVRPDLLTDYGVSLFDSFAGTFGNVVEGLEETPSGFKEVERFAEYVNGPELLTMFFSGADVRLTKDADLKLPKMTGGKPEIVISEKSPELRKFLNRILAEWKAWENLTGREKRKQRHVPLVLYGQAKKATVDLRLVDPNFYKFDPNGKVGQAVENLYRIWKDTAQKKSTQIVFLDIFQDSSKNPQFNAHKDIKDRLVAKGIPEGEIILFGDLTEKRMDDAKARIRTGDARIVIGTTQKLGIGVDIADKMIAAHHISVPDRPMDIEQRNGRIIRQTNENPEVQILNYCAKDTLDSVLFHRLYKKQRFSDQVLTGDIEGRTFADPYSEEQVSFAEFAAAASGEAGKLLFEKNDLTAQEHKYKVAETAYIRQISNAKAKARGLPDQIAEQKKKIADLTARAEQVRKMFPDGKMDAVTYEGKTMERGDFIKIVEEKAAALQEKAEKELPKIKMGDFDYHDYHVVMRFSVGDVQVTMKMEAETNYNKFDALKKPSTKMEFKFLSNMMVQYKLDDRMFGNGTDWISPENFRSNFTKKFNSQIASVLDSPAYSQNYLAEKEKELAEFKSIAKTPFKYTEELASLRKRIAEINQELIKISRDVEEEGGGGPVTAEDGEQRTEAGEPNAREGKIQLGVYPNQTAEITATIIGDYAWHSDVDKEKSGYTVTHVPSQLAVQRDLTKEDAKVLAQTFAEKMTEKWNGKNLASEAFNKEAIKVLNEFKKREASNPAMADSWDYMSAVEDERIDRRQKLLAEGTTAKGYLEMMAGGEGPRSVEGDLAAFLLEQHGAQLEKLPVELAENETGANYLGSAHRIRMGVYRTYNPEQMDRTLLHEVVHGLTSRLLNRNQQARKDMEGLLSEARKYISPADLKALEAWGFDPRRINRALEEDAFTAGESVNVLYGLTNVHEFLAQAFTDEKFQDFLRGITLKRAVPETSLWQKFVSLVGKVLGLNEKQTTLLDMALYKGAVLMKEDAWNVEQGAYRGATQGADIHYALHAIPLAANPPSGAETARDMDRDRSFVNTLFEMKDLAVFRINKQTKDLQVEVQGLAGKASRKRIHLGIGYQPKLKRSQTSDMLDRAMLVYRDMQARPEKAGEFRAWAEKQIAGALPAQDRVRIKRQLEILDMAEKLTPEQQRFTEKMGALFEDGFRMAKAQGIINTHRDYYVRRLWKQPTQTGGYGSNGFKTFTTASMQRSLETVLDGWMRGYELQVEGITSSYGEYMSELATVMANRAFVTRGVNTRDAEGGGLFSVDKLPGYARLKAEGFSVWRWKGDIVAKKEEEGVKVLAVNNYGKRFFATAPDEVPRMWAVHKVVDGSPRGRAERLFTDREEAQEWADERKYETVIKERPPEDRSDLFEKAPLFAPAPLAEMINKMTSTDTLFNKTPGVAWLLRFNAGLKAWILMSSFFHHLAGARSWVFGVHHGWKKANPVAAYKAGLRKIDDLHPLVELGIKNGLTLGQLQDWSEKDLRQQKGMGERLLNYLGMEKAVKTAEYLKFKRESWADSLFKKFFAGLKAEAFVMEYTHDLNKAAKKYAAGKSPEPPNPEKIAERVARLINADFGGLHLQRMGRHPSLQKVARLLLLAPDWTESNFRTVTGMIPGANKLISKMLQDVPPPKGMEAIYRKFWGRVLLRIAVSTIIAQMLLNGKDDTDDFVEEQMLSNRFNKFRWTELDISKLYKMLGIEMEDQRKTFSLGGHFFDILKLIDPASLIKGKGSPVVRLLGAGFTGSDWADRPFTGAVELAQTGKTVKKSAHQQTEGFFNRLPATVANQVINNQPIQVGQFIRYLQGEADGLTALSHSAGAAIHTAWPPKQTGPILQPKDGGGMVYEAVNKLLESDALKMGPPSRYVAINGEPVKMEHAVYKEYVEQSSRMAAQRLSRMVTTNRWANMDEDARADLVRKVVTAARKRLRPRIKRQMLLDRRKIA